MARFSITVYSPRWGHDDTYQLDVDDNGWVVAHQSFNGSCDPDGVPVLYQSFRQDEIIYPGTFTWYMRELWEHAHNGTLSDEEIQRRLNRLAQWLRELSSVAVPEF